MESIVTDARDTCCRPGAIKQENAGSADHSLSGKDNVRFYSGGIPQAFMDGDQVTGSAVDRLI